MNKDMDFKLVGKNVIIKTEASVEMDEFVRRVIGLHRQQRQGEGEITKMEKDFEVSKMNLVKMQEDIDYSFKFLKSIHRTDLTMKIEKEVEEMRKMEEKYSAVGPTMAKGNEPEVEEKDPEVEEEPEADKHEASEPNEVEAKEEKNE